MRTARTALTTLVLAGALSAAAAAQPSLPAMPHPATFGAIGVAVGVHAPVGVDSFYSNLAPYGHWVQRPNYGWVWLPRHARHAWRPYSSGRWAYTDYGWTWVSTEPFGWATYHYGRWYDDPDYGWGWVPGTDWGPAWVDWRQGNGYLGWAPLPPSIGFSVGVGLQFGSGFALAPGAYCFVPERHFLDANVGGFIGSPGRNAAFFNNTRNINNYAVENGRVFNRSVPLDHIQQVTGRPVRQMRLAEASAPGTARVSGNSVAMFRPSVVSRANAPDPLHVAPHAVATGRVAQQLQQEHRAMARSTAAQGGQRGGTRGAPTVAGHQAVAAHHRAPQSQSPAQQRARQRTQQSQARHSSQASQQQAQQSRRRHQAPAAQPRAQQVQSHRQSAPPPRRTQQAPSQRQQQQAQVRRQAPPQHQQQARQQPPPRPQQQARALAPRRQQQPPPGGPGGR